MRAVSKTTLDQRPKRAAEPQNAFRDLRPAAGAEAEPHFMVGFASRRIIGTTPFTGHIEHVFRKGPLEKPGIASRMHAAGEPGPNIQPTPGGFPLHFGRKVFPDGPGHD